MRWIRKDVFDLTIPILIEQFFVMSMGMINTIMAGHIGKEAVSSIGMVDAINNIFIAFFTALAIGGTVVVAQFVGNGNIIKANDTMKQTLFSSLLISLLITIIMCIFKNQIIAALFGAAESKIISGANIYLGITLLTYPLITISLVANGILRGAGDTKTPMKITVFMNFINVLFTFLFINILNMGITGAALGIAIARITGSVIILLVLIRGSKIIILTKIKEFKFNMELLKPIFSIGIPASMESLLFNGGKLITQIYIVDMGTVAIASNAIGSSIANMLNIPGNALCITAVALIGQHMGRGESEKAENTLSYITKFATISLAIECLLFIPFAGITVAMYTNNIDIINLSSKILIANCLCIPIWSISFVLPSGLKGAGDAKYTMVTAMIGMWVFRISLGYLLGVTLDFGLLGVWMGMFSDWFVRGSLYYLRFKKGKWKNNVVIKPSIAS